MLRNDDDVVFSLLFRLITWVEGESRGSLSWKSGQLNKRRRKRSCL